jgi:hypothetical protein
MISWTCRSMVSFAFLTCFISSSSTLAPTRPLAPAAQVGVGSGGWSGNGVGRGGLRERAEWRRQRIVGAGEMGQAAGCGGGGSRRRKRSLAIRPPACRGGPMWRRRGRRHATSTHPVPPACRRAFWSRCAPRHGRRSGRGAGARPPTSSPHCACPGHTGTARARAQGAGVSRLKVAGVPPRLCFWWGKGEWSRIKVAGVQNGALLWGGGAGGVLALRWGGRGARAWGRTPGSPPPPPPHTHTDTPPICGTHCVHDHPCLHPLPNVSHGGMVHPKHHPKAPDPTARPTARGRTLTIASMAMHASQSGTSLISAPGANCRCKCKHQVSARHRPGRAMPTRRPHAPAQAQGAHAHMPQPNPRVRMMRCLGNLGRLRAWHGAHTHMHGQMGHVRSVNHQCSGWQDGVAACVPWREYRWGGGSPPCSTRGRRSASCPAGGGSRT